VALSARWDGTLLVVLLAVHLTMRTHQIIEIHFSAIIVAIPAGDPASSIVRCRRTFWRVIDRRRRTLHVGRS
jgi:hypothetical protein